jgi:hypothetical protein
VAGFVAACAYDVFRIPFVVAAIDGIGPEWLRLPLFKVFPRFGAMILGQPFDPAMTDSQFTLPSVWPIRGRAIGGYWLCDFMHLLRGANAGGRAQIGPV